MTLDDVNEFSPDFERHFYTASLDFSDEQLQLEELDELEDKQALDALNNGEQVKKTPKLDKRRRRDETLLVTVRAHDQDCSSEFGSICRYELLPSGAGAATSGAASGQQNGDGSAQHGASADQLEGLSVDVAGRIWIRHLPKSWRSAIQERRKQQQQQQTASSNLNTNSNSNLNSNNGAYLVRSFQVIAYDCAGKKSQTPASVQVSLNKLCRPSLRGKFSIFFPLRLTLSLCFASCDR